jgi:hypothetical protein
MKCYCYENETEFIFCIENAEIEYEKNIEAAWFQKKENKYLKIYPRDIDDKEIIKYNFLNFGESMFKLDGNWEKTLYFFANKCLENNIKWYITGSVSEAIIGVKIKPHDIDIVIHTSDFYKVKNLFIDYLIEPFVDNHGNWVVRYFGRLCVDGVMIDVVADESRNNNNHIYETVNWKDFKINIEPLKQRYEIELQRKREKNIKAIEEYLKNKEK